MVLLGKNRDLNTKITDRIKYKNCSCNFTERDAKIPAKEL
jgi:hypothetical protein